MNSVIQLLFKRDENNCTGGCRVPVLEDVPNSTSILVAGAKAE
jgi:hypothetical protein